MITIANLHLQLKFTVMSLNSVIWNSIRCLVGVYTSQYFVDVTSHWCPKIHKVLNSGQKLPKLIIPIASDSKSYLKTILDTNSIKVRMLYWWPYNVVYVGHAKCLSFHRSVEIGEILLQSPRFVIRA